MTGTEVTGIEVTGIEAADIKVAGIKMMEDTAIKRMAFRSIELLSLILEQDIDQAR